MEDEEELLSEARNCWGCGCGLLGDNIAYLRYYHFGWRAGSHGSEAIVKGQIIKFRFLML